MQQVKYVANARNFTEIPGTLIAYWASENVIKVFKNHKGIRQKYKPDCGIKTGNNELFLRLWYEVSLVKTCITPEKKSISLNQHKWFKYNKGGGYRKWYGGYEHVVNFEDNARDIKKLISKDTYRLRNPEDYFNVSIIWPLIGDIRFSARQMNPDTLSDVASNIIYLINGMDYYLIALMNSVVFNEILKLINSTVSYPIDSVASVPTIFIENRLVEKIAEDNIAYCKFDWDSFENSWDFKKHPLI